MLSYFSQPYPHNHLTTRHWLLTSAGTGLFVSLFLVFFQPFGSSQWHDPRKPLLLGGYGVVTFICVASISYFIPRWFKNWYIETHWTVGREIVWNILMILLITFGNLLYSQCFLGMIFSLRSMLFWLGITASIGIIPATVITLLNYNRLLRKHSTGSLLVKGAEASMKSTTEQQDEIRLIAENGKDTLVLMSQDLLFIESADNYSEVVFWKDNKIQKVLIRSSLSRIEEQINQAFIVRCHRSYIINLRQVTGISGNAQGYKLQFQNWESTLPVARRYTDLVKEYFKK
jgi:LytTr DNA-binding domain